MSELSRTSALASRHTELGSGLVHLRPDAAQPGTRLDVVSDDFSGNATVETTPFFDPAKSRTHG